MLDSGGPAVLNTSSINTAVGWMENMDVDPDTVERVRTILLTAMEQMKQPPQPVSESAFGGSPAGQLMGSSTSTAHGYVVDAMMAMVKGLKEFEQGVISYQADVENTDRDNAGRMTGITARVEGVSAVPPGAAEASRARACLADPSLNNPACAPTSGGNNR